MQACVQFGELIIKVLEQLLCIGGGGSHGSSGVLGLGGGGYGSGMGIIVVSDTSVRSLLVRGPLVGGG
jgi:hypothetical protein